ncbi:MAG TPA: 4'-phosphopantetheinyl transferase superfamily protein [Bryobacteraceae bacterium]|jgi:4'-phosphopantetheinyl transferase
MREQHKLHGRVIEIWIFPTETSDAACAKFERLLAPDEKVRAERFRFDRLRKSFIATRGALRCLLGRYLSLPPASLEFHYGSKGKPTLAPAMGIDFNATHSGDLAAFAFTLGSQLGIDLEHVHPLAEMQDIAGRFFCPEEAAELASLSPDDREAAFFRCWTRKEAYIKAIGDGLSAPLDAFRVTLHPNELARFVHIAHDTNVAQAWTLHDLRLSPGYAAALAYHDRERPLSLFQLADPAELFDRP